MLFTKRTLCFLFSIVFLASCNNKHNQQDYISGNPYNMSPVEQIIKMRPVKIICSHWIDYVKNVKLKMETEKEAISAFNNPDNWITYLEITDTEKINKIMTALAALPVETQCNYMLPIRDKICFKDKDGNFKSTMFLLLDDLKEVYISDKVYGQETYEVLAKFLYENKP